MEYRSFGAGPPLVMVLGLNDPINHWDPALLDLLGRRHRVIIFDNRGVGRSTTTPGPLTIERMADDTAGLIRVLRLHRPAVLGWSMGAIITLDLGVRHPRTVGQLIICGAIAGGRHTILPSPQVIMQLFSLSFDESLPLAFPQDQRGAVARYRAAIRRWPRPETVSPQTTQAQTSALIAWTGKNAGVYARLPRVRIPTLVADGAEDIVTPPQNARQIARRIPGAKLLLYPDAGHGFLFQDRAAFAHDVLHFLGT